MSIEDPGLDPACDCDHEKVFVLADGGLEGEAAREVRGHLDRCPPCRELYEHEVKLNSSLRSADFLEGRPSCSVHKAVAMALPTRSPVARLLWAALAVGLLILALVYLQLNGTEPVILVASVLAACWGFVTGVADVIHAVLAAAGTTILLVLGIGALVDLLLAAAFVTVNRGRRAREA